MQCTRRFNLFFNEVNFRVYDCHFILMCHKGIIILINSSVSRTVQVNLIEMSFKLTPREEYYETNVSLSTTN